MIGERLNILPAQIKVLYVEQYPVFEQNVSVYNEILQVTQKLPL